MAQNAVFIVTGDDFGYSSETNGGVIAGLRAGLVSHASIMVNMRGFAEARDVAHNAGVAGRVGLHLNLAEGVPLTEPMRRSERFCSDGVYNDPDTRNRFSPLTPHEKHVLADEIRAQFAKARSAGFSCEHLDSHRYVHTMPNVAGLIIGVARELGIKRIRPYQNSGPTAARAKVVGKALYNTWLSMRGMKRVQYFGSIDDFEWLARRHGTRVRSAEIMTHPRLGPDGVVLDGSAGSLRERLVGLERMLDARIVAPSQHPALA